MSDEKGSVQKWRSSAVLPWARLFGGLLLVCAGVWLVVAGPLFHRLWLAIIGAILLVLGGYLFSIGVRSLHHAGPWMMQGVHSPSDVGYLWQTGEAGTTSPR